MKSDDMTSFELHDWIHIAKCHKNYLGDNQSIYRVLEIDEIMPGIFYHNMRSVNRNENA